MRARRYRSLFSHYGGKSKIAHLYPAPKYPTIIEPFAGGASYSLHWMLKESHLFFVLNELDSRTREIWSFMFRDDVLEWVSRIPDEIQVGQRVSDLVPGAPTGLIELMRAECNIGTQGAKGVHEQITKFGLDSVKRIKSKVDFWWPIIKNRATFLGWDYRDLPDTEATWFVDPPYSNEAGKRYRTQVGDYGELAEWCKSRKGQVIVCENEGATWLPFQPIAERQGVKSRYQKSETKEVVWCS